VHYWSTPGQSVELRGDSLTLAIFTVSISACSFHSQCLPTYNNALFKNMCFLNHSS